MVLNISKLVNFKNNNYFGIVGYDPIFERQLLIFTLGVISGINITFICFSLFYTNKK